MEIVKLDPKWIKRKDIKGFLYFVERFLKEFLECRVRNKINYSYKFKKKTLGNLVVPLKLYVMVNRIELSQYCGNNSLKGCNILKDCFNAYFEYKLQTIIKLTVEFQVDKIKLLKDNFEIEFMES